MRPRILQLFLLAPLLLATGCATLPAGKRDPRDRFESFNRPVFAFNQAVDRSVARPVAKAYVKVTPAPLRAGVSNFVANLGYPVVIVNDLLQAKGVQTAQDVSRLLVNTVLGLGGLFDPATGMGLESHNEDFGQTLGRWGVGPGPYLVLPFLGPSDLRDGLGRVPDYFSTPRSYLDDQGLRWGLTGLDLLDLRAATLEASDVMNRAFDPTRSCATPTCSAASSSSTTAIRRTRRPPKTRTIQPSSEPASLMPASPSRRAGTDA